MLAARRVDLELDELALRRAQRGEERAWRELIARFERPVYGLIWRMMAGRARHRVEDLTQETFVRVLGGLPRFDPAGPATLSTWILTIAARLVLNELRRAEATELASEPMVDDGPEAGVERRRLGRAIAVGVAKLPDAQRAVFVLREYHGFDYAEIAEALAIDLGTVKSRLSRARAALREHLTALGERRE